MVFGNLDSFSASGFVMLRNNTTDCVSPDGDLSGQWNRNAQTMDIFENRRAFQHVAVREAREWAAENGVSEADRALWSASLQEELPTIFVKLLDMKGALEYQLTDAISRVPGWIMEFVIEQDNLWLTRICEPCTQDCEGLAAHKGTDHSKPCLNASSGSALVSRHIPPIHSWNDHKL